MAGCHGRAPCRESPAASHPPARRCRRRARRTGFVGWGLGCAGECRLPGRRPGGARATPRGPRGGARACAASAVKSSPGAWPSRVRPHSRLVHWCPAYAPGRAAVSAETSASRSPGWWRSHAHAQTALASACGSSAGAARRVRSTRVSMTSKPGYARMRPNAHSTAPSPRGCSACASSPARACARGRRPLRPPTRRCSFTGGLTRAPAHVTHASG